MDICYICGPELSVGNGISFHEFPVCKTKEDAWVLEKWLTYVEMYGLSSKWITESTKLCSNHFISEDFIDAIYTQCSSKMANSTRYLKYQAYPSVMVEVVEVVLPDDFDDYDDDSFMEKDNNVVLKKNKGTDDMLKENPVEEDNVLIIEEGKKVDWIEEQYITVLEEEEDSANEKPNKGTDDMLKEKPMEEDNVLIKEGGKNVHRIKEEDSVKEKPEEVDYVFIKEDEKMCAQIKEVLSLEDTAVVDESSTLQNNNFVLKDEEETVFIDLV